MSQPFTRLTAIAAPLLRDNIDTDAIIPSREMKTVSKTGLAGGLFAGWRYLEIGERNPDPSFVLNDPRFTNAQVLLGGANFGCGSSREHAVWALAEYGFRTILASSFNPIFRNNCVANGILPIILGAREIASIASAIEATPGDLPVTVDLELQQVQFADHVLEFSIDSQSKTILLSGLDVIDLTLRDYTRQIARKRAAQWLAQPWI